MYNNLVHTRVSKPFPIRIHIIPHDVDSEKRFRCRSVLSGSKGCPIGSLYSCLKQLVKQWKVIRTTHDYRISLDIYVWTRLITFTEYQKQLCDMTLTTKSYTRW